MNDQRRAVRLHVNEEYSEIDDFLAEYVTNLSRTGAFIRSKQLLPIGTRVDLRFSVVLDDFETIEGIGEVVRVVEEEPDRGMGVRFIELSERSREVVDRIADREEAAATGATEES